MTTGHMTCESAHRIEINNLRRRQLLAPGRCTTLKWSCAGRTTGSVALGVTEAGLNLHYIVTDHRGLRQPISEFVPFAKTATNFNASRLWLTCIRCRRRVGILYAGTLFRCRKCHGLSYESQCQSRWQRALHAADKIRRRVGRYGFDEDAFPPKPKWMRWRTYNDLETRYDHLMNDWAAGAMMNFG